MKIARKLARGSFPEFVRPSVHVGSSGTDEDTWSTESREARATVTEDKEKEKSPLPCLPCVLVRN